MATTTPPRHTFAAFMRHWGSGLAVAVSAVTLLTFVAATVYNEGADDRQMEHLEQGDVLIRADINRLEANILTVVQDANTRLSELEKTVAKQSGLVEALYQQGMRDRQ